MICNNATGIIGWLRARALQVCEVVLNIIVDTPNVLWQTFAESIIDLSILIIDWKMAKHMAFEIINGVQADKINPDGMMEIFRIHVCHRLTACIALKQLSYQRRRFPINLIVPLLVHAEAQRNKSAVEHTFRGIPFQSIITSYWIELTIPSSIITVSRVFPLVEIKALLPLKEFAP